MMLQITTHSGLEVNVEENHKTVADIDTERNNRELESILIGDHSFSRIDVKNIIPLYPTSEGETTTTISILNPFEYKSGGSVSGSTTSV